ncbi:MAG TPA: glycine oxidase ThiO [Pyrinomonadaceae bacterium]|jgi:glycine oxidase|nr:glycine oxidase ThiO [Pyrinomonadaceae bacterium]
MRSQESFSAGDVAADVVIVGGGVIGLSIARSLARRGVRRVTLIERASPGAEASSAAGGMLAAQAEADRADAFLELACASRDLYPSLALELKEETGVDIELERTGTLYLGFTEEDEAEMSRRYNWQASAGLTVQKLTPEEARLIEPGISQSVRSALLFPLDAQVENRRLVAALVASVEKYGVRLMTSTEALNVRIERGEVRSVETSRGTVSAPFIIIAGGAWSSLIGGRLGAGDSRGNDMSSELPALRIEPVRGQMLCFDARQRLARHVLYSPRGYLVPRMDGRLLAGSTTEHAGFDRRVTGVGVHAIMTHAIEIAPSVGELALVDYWSGLRPRAEDDLPVLGTCASVRGLVYATGHYRNGILLAPITGEMIADVVTRGVMPPLLRAFTPDRFQCASMV